MDSDVILHLFDWRFRDVLQAIPGIVADGFGAIQISPPQLSVDTEEWWGRYQPIDHTRIEGPLGSELELRDLIRKAHQSDPPLRVIIDVVFNHMAETQPEREFLRYPRFGPEHFHVQAAIDWRSVESIRTGWVGYGPDLPDLRTEHPYVRAEARKYLELLLDCGADGFRFDAVKHIEPEFFDEVLKDLTSALIVYGEYILQPGHKPVMEQYLGSMRLMDFALLETMAKAFTFGGDMRMLVDPASQGHALSDHQGIAFVTNHDLELGEVGGFGLSADSLNLGHVYTITRPESIPLIWKEHRHNPVVKACMKLRNLSQSVGREIVLQRDHLLAWRFGDQGAAIINASQKAINMSAVDLGLRDITAINMLTGSPVEREIVVQPRRPLLLWIS
jgi:alpha-amylase